MIIVMRKDLNMRKGKMIAQGSHASVGLVLDLMKIQNPPLLRFQEWLNTSFKKICVSVSSEQELHTILNKAKEAGLYTKLILDAAHTEFDKPTYTCGAIGPATNEELKDITGSLPLL